MPHSSRCRQLICSRSEQYDFKSIHIARFDRFNVRFLAAIVCMFCPASGESRCMDGACIVRAPLPGQYDWQEEFRTSRPWEVIAEKGCTGAEVADLLKLLLQHVTTTSSGELHFGLHPLSAYDEVEFVSSATHLDWMERVAKSDAFIRMVLQRSEQTQTKHGPHSRLRVSEDFMGELAAMPVSNNLDP